MSTNKVNIIKIGDLDVNKVTFTAPIKPDTNGRKTAFINYDKGPMPWIQTPRMSVVNGVKRWRKKDATDNKDDSFEVQLSFGGDNDDVKVFQQKMEQLDEKMTEYIIQNSMELIGKPKTKASKDVVEAFYNPLVKIAMDKDGNLLDYPAGIRVKIDRDRDSNGDGFTGKFISNKRTRDQVLIFDGLSNDKNTALPFNESNFESVIPKGSKMVSVIKFSHINVTSKVSVKTVLTQGKVYRNSQSVTEYAMLDDSDLDEDVPKVEVEAEVEDLDTEGEVEAEDKDEVEAEVEDELDDEESEEEVKPVAKPKSRVKRGAVV